MEAVSGLLEDLPFRDKVGLCRTAGLLSREVGEVLSKLNELLLDPERFDDLQHTEAMTTTLHGALPAFLREATTLRSGPGVGELADTPRKLLPVLEILATHLRDLRSSRKALSRG